MYRELKIIVKKNRSAQIEKGHKLGTEISVAMHKQATTMIE